MNLGKELALKARKKGICPEWFYVLKKEQDIDTLLDIYLKGIDFCLSNDYPSNEYIREHFKGKMESKGIFLDDRVSLINEKKVVALGSSAGRIEVNGHGVCQVFLKHNSEFTIVAKDNSFLMIDIFDNVTVIVNASGEAKVCVNRYGSAKLTCNQIENAIIKVVEKNKKTY